MKSSLANRHSSLSVTHNLQASKIEIKLEDAKKDPTLSEILEEKVWQNFHVIILALSKKLNGLVVMHGKLQAGMLESFLELDYMSKVREMLIE